MTRCKVAFYTLSGGIGCDIGAAFCLAQNLHVFSPNSNIMRKLLFVAIALAAVACNRKATVGRAPQAVKVCTVESVGSIARDYAGMATADNSTNLAFKVGGQVTSFDVSEGQAVHSGQVVAEISPRDYQLSYDADRSSYEAARSQLERAKRLLARQAISQNEYENAQNTYASALAAFRNSADVLKDTKLRTPLSGIVEKKYVDTYQRVSAGEVVVRIVDPLSHTVKFTMPESGLKLLSDRASQFSVEYDNYKGVWFDASLKDYVASSSDGTGIPVTLKVSIPSKYVISPGLSCTVRVSSSEPDREAVAVPLTAVAASDGSDSTYVWVVSDGCVHRAEVHLGALYGADMVIVDGLAAGENIVTAGVYKLSEGERVVSIH